MIAKSSDFVVQNVMQHSSGRRTPVRPGGPRLTGK